MTKIPESIQPSILPTEEKAWLPEGYIPKPSDILCGRGRSFAAHPGNRRFSDIIKANLERYERASARHEKTAVVEDIMQYVIVGHKSRFLKYHSGRKVYYCLPRPQVHEKVSHAIRDCMNKDKRTGHAVSLLKKLKKKNPHHVGVKNNKNGGGTPADNTQPRSYPIQNGDAGNRDRPPPPPAYGGATIAVQQSRTTKDKNKHASSSPRHRMGEHPSPSVHPVARGGADAATLRMSGHMGLHHGHNRPSSLVGHHAGSPRIMQLQDNGRGHYHNQQPETHESRASRREGSGAAPSAALSSDPPPRNQALAYAAAVQLLGADANPSRRQIVTPSPYVTHHHVVPQGPPSTSMTTAGPWPGPATLASTAAAGYAIQPYPHHLLAAAPTLMAHHPHAGAASVPTSTLHTRLSLSYDQWTAPPPISGWKTIRTLDVHTEGEPLRVFVDGLPPLQGRTVLDQRQDAKERYDNVRKLLMLEPRGHGDMYGCWIVEPNRPARPVTKEQLQEAPKDEKEATADFGVLFLHNEGFSSMRGHGIIGVAKVAVELGFCVGEAIQGNPLERRLKIDAPAGRIVATAYLRPDSIRPSVSRVAFDNVPSFAVALDHEIRVYGLSFNPRERGDDDDDDDYDDENICTVLYDLAYGGAFYAYVDMRKNPQLNFGLTSKDVPRIIKAANLIKKVIARKAKISHPKLDEVSFLYGVVFVGDACSVNHHSRNICVFADGEVDRSPTGTGVSGRVAIDYARDQIELKESIEIESILGTTFLVQVEREVEDYDDSLEYPVVIPRVTGTAHITGKHEFLVDPQDPIQEGFVLR